MSSLGVQNIKSRCNHYSWLCLLLSLTLIDPHIVQILISPTYNALSVQFFVHDYHPYGHDFSLI